MSAAEAAPVAADAAAPAVLPAESGAASSAAGGALAGGGAAAAPVAGEGEEEGRLLAAVRKQVEYYFSDFNFRTDKFLRHKAGEDADGFVVLDVLLTFNKIKALKVSDPKVLSRALEDSEELELSEDGTSVRRTRALPEENDSEARSVYAKGPFPSDATLEQLRDWAGAAGVVGRVNMRKMNNKEKTFKGSVFIEYAKAEGCAALLEQFAKGELRYEGAPLLKVEPLKAYSARKKVEREERRAKKAAAGGGAAKKAGGGGAAGAGAAAAGAAPKRPARDAAEKVEEEDEAAVMVPSKDGPRAFKKEMVPGTIMRVADMGSHSSVDTRGKLQTFFNAMSDSKLKYVEYDPATRMAYARFSTAEACTAVLTAIKAGGPNVKEATGSEAPVGTILEGAEELEHWEEKVWKSQIQAMANAGRGRGGWSGGGGGGRGRGGRGGGGGRGGFRGRGGGGGGRGGRGGGGAGEKRGREGGGDDRQAKRAAPSAAE